MKVFGSSEIRSSACILMLIKKERREEQVILLLMTLGENAKESYASKRKKKEFSVLAFPY